MIKKNEVLAKKAAEAAEAKAEEAKAAAINAEEAAAAAAKAAAKNADVETRATAAAEEAKAAAKNAEEAAAAATKAAAEADTAAKDAGIANAAAQANVSILQQTSAQESANAANTSATQANAYADAANTSAAEAKASAAEAEKKAEKAKKNAAITLQSANRGFFARRTVRRENINKLNEKIEKLNNEIEGLNAEKADAAPADAKAAAADAKAAEEAKAKAEEVKAEEVKKTAAEAKVKKAEADAEAAKIEYKKFSAELDVLKHKSAQRINIPNTENYEEDSRKYRQDNNEYQKITKTQEYDKFIQKKKRKLYYILDLCQHIDFEKINMFLKNIIVQYDYVSKDNDLHNGKKFSDTKQKNGIKLATENLDYQQMLEVMKDHFKIINGALNEFWEGYLAKIKNYYEDSMGKDIQVINTTILKILKILQHLRYAQGIETDSKFDISLIADNSLIYKINLYDFFKNLIYSNLHIIEEPILDDDNYEEKFERSREKLNEDFARFYDEIYKDFETKLHQNIDKMDIMKQMTKYGLSDIINNIESASYVGTEDMLKAMFVIQDLFITKTKEEKELELQLEKAENEKKSANTLRDKAIQEQSELVAKIQELNSEISEKESKIKEEQEKIAEKNKLIEEQIAEKSKEIAEKSKELEESKEKLKELKELEEKRAKKKEELRTRFNELDVQAVEKAKAPVEEQDAPVEEQDAPVEEQEEAKAPVEEQAAAQVEEQAAAQVEEPPAPVAEEQTLLDSLKQFVILNKFIRVGHKTDMSSRTFYDNLISNLGRRIDKDDKEKIEFYLTNGANNLLVDEQQGTNKAITEINKYAKTPYSETSGFFNVENYEPIYNIEHVDKGKRFVFNDKIHNNKNATLNSLIANMDKPLFVEATKYTGATFFVSREQDFKFHNFKVNGVYHLKGWHHTKISDHYNRGGETKTITINDTDDTIYSVNDNIFVEETIEYKKLVFAYYSAVLDHFFNIIKEKTNYSILHLCQVPGAIYGGTDTTKNIFKNTIYGYLCKNKEYLQKLKFKISIDYDDLNFTNDDFAEYLTFQDSKFNEFLKK